jgi:hypothetical protein
MDEVVADAPADQEIHVILDNYATHKKNDARLKANPNVTFHFTRHRLLGSTRSKSGSAFSDARP